MRANTSSLLRLTQFALIKPYEVLMFLIQMNTPMLRNQPAGCAAWACSFELKTLRLHRVLSLQIAAAVTNCLR